jgi:hypothetical protein
MRGVNLSVFDFDYDLTWAGFFLNCDEGIYGRYGGRDPGSPDTKISLAGLRYAMLRALAAHRNADTQLKPRPTEPTKHTVDEYPAARRRPDSACIHCHHVYDFRREALQSEGRWRLDQVWVYPLPENVGLSLEVDKGDRVTAVATDSPAFRAGLRVDDKLTSVSGIRVTSIADVQYGLHRAPAEGPIPVTWLRDGKPVSGHVNLPEGWRRTDISWRWSLRGLEPTVCVHGEDLTATEKWRFGLSAEQLAFRQGNFVSTPARQAGIRQNDVIIGIDNKRLIMNARQFQVYVKLNYKVGDRVTYNVLREGKPVDIPVVLTSRPAF